MLKDDAAWSLLSPPLLWLLFSVADILHLSTCDLLSSSLLSYHPNHKHSCSTICHHHLLAKCLIDYED